MRALIILSILAGCAAAAPIISDISDSAVHVQARVDVPMADLNAKADEACAVYGKARSEPMSEKRFGDYDSIRNVLYACQ